jgi:hypothetical protein
MIGRKPRNQLRIAAVNTKRHSWSYPIGDQRRKRPTGIIKSRFAAPAASGIKFVNAELDA